MYKSIIVLCVCCALDLQECSAEEQASGENIHCLTC